MSQPSEGAPPLPSLPVRVAQVFVAPAALFERLRERPAWLGVLVLAIAVNVAAAYFTPEEIRRQAMESFLPAGTDPAQIDRMVEGQQIQGAIGALVGGPILVALLAGVLLLAYNVVLGGEATFRQLFSAAAHAYLIPTAGALLVLGLMFAGSNQPILSPALLLPDLGDGFLARLVGLIDVFIVWTCVVLGIATSRIYPRRGAAGAATYLLVMYLLFAAGVAAVLGVVGGA